MKKFLGSLGLAFVGLFTSANAALTPPAADYADVYTMAAYAVGILVTLFVIKKAISFVK